MMKAVFLIILSSGMSAGAQSLSWDVFLQIDSAPNDWEMRLKHRVFPGLIEVETSRITGTGDEVLLFDSRDPGFTLSLTFSEESYSAADDPAMGLPALYFSNGELKGLDFAVFLSASSYGEGAFFQLHPDGLMNYSPDGVGEYEGSYSVEAFSIPEPSFPSLVALGVSLFLTFRKR